MNVLLIALYISRRPSCAACFDASFVVYNGSRFDVRASKCWGLRHLKNRILSDSHENSMFSICGVTRPACHVIASHSVVRRNMARSIMTKQRMMHVTTFFFNCSPHSAQAVLRCVCVSMLQALRAHGAKLDVHMSNAQDLSIARWVTFRALRVCMLPNVQWLTRCTDVAFSSVENICTCARARFPNATFRYFAIPSLHSLVSDPASGSIFCHRSRGIKFMKNRCIPNIFSQSMIHATLACKSLQW